MKVLEDGSLKVKGKEEQIKGDIIVKSHTCTICHSDQREKDKISPCGRNDRGWRSE